MYEELSLYFHAFIEELSRKSSDVSQVIIWEKSLKN